MEIASLQGLTLQCSEINHQNSHWHVDVRFYGLKTMTFHCVAGCIVNMAIQRIVLSRSTNFDRMQNGAWLKVTPTTFWLKCKNLPKCTEFCSARKLEVADKNFDLLTKKSCHALANTGA